MTYTVLWNKLYFITQLSYCYCVKQLYILVVSKMNNILPQELFGIHAKQVLNLLKKGN